MVIKHYFVNLGSVCLSDVSKPFYSPYAHDGHDYESFSGESHNYELCKCVYDSPSLWVEPNPTHLRKVRPILLQMVREPPSPTPRPHRDHEQAFPSRRRRRWRPGRRHNFTLIFVANYLHKICKNICNLIQISGHLQPHAIQVPKSGWQLNR